MTRNHTFNSGDPVWIYIPPCWPKEGVVTRVNGITVYVDDGTGEVFHPSVRLFHRPAEREALLAEMRADVDHISQAIERLESEAE